jgi:hypothetical protein
MGFERSTGSVAEAVALLRTADTFDDAHVGIDGALSKFVVAFRTVLADPGAADAFRELLQHATPAGRLYGAAGLFFADPPAFDAALARLGADGGVIRRRQGCFTMQYPVATVVSSPKRVDVKLGETFQSAVARSPRGAACELSGGCIPMSFVEASRTAPRGPTS